MRTGRCGITLLVEFALFCVPVVLAETEPGTPEREYPFPIAVVETALRQMGAYTGARLPELEGFVITEGAQLPPYERPYYEYKIALVPVKSDRTVVRVKASISAWYQDPAGQQSGYRALHSNGRLEGDLFDRLEEFLTHNKSKIVTDPDVLAKRLAGVRQQRLDAERRVAELQKQLQAVQSKPITGKVLEYASVNHPVAIVSAPGEPSSLLLRAAPEDEFQVLEHRGGWLRVALEDSRDGWVKSSQVQLVAASPGSAPETHKASPGSADFAVIREEVSLFSGDWPRLKDKQALYVFVRPEGSLVTGSEGRKLHFAETIFRERYQEIVHSSQLSVAGIVVIFLDQRGGVAAASTEDIGRLTEGSLTQGTFLKKCSFDPAGAFENVATSPKTAGP